MSTAGQMIIQDAVRGAQTGQTIIQNGQQLMRLGNGVVPLASAGQVPLQGIVPGTTSIIPANVMRTVEDAQNIANNASAIIPVRKSQEVRTTIPDERPSRVMQANQPMRIDLIPSVLTPPATPVPTPVTTLERKPKEKRKRKPEASPPKEPSESESTESEEEPEITVVTLKEPEPLKEEPVESKKEEPAVVVAVIEEAPKQAPEPPKPTVTILEPVKEKKAVTVIETPTIIQQPKPILKTPTILTPVPVVVEKPPAIIKEEPVSKVSVDTRAVADEDEEGCCGYSWRCCTITWSTLFSILLAGFIGYLIWSLINMDKQKSNLKDCVNCDANEIKESLTPNAPGKSIDFPYAWVSFDNQLGSNAVGVDRYFLVGAQVHLNNVAPSVNAMMIWECGCTIKVEYNSVNNIAQTQFVGDEQKASNYYKFLQLDSSRPYTMTMEPCSMNNALIALIPLDRNQGLNPFRV